MPPKMGNLKNLLTLRKFKVGKQNGSDIEELEKLLHLQELSVYNLENVVGRPKDIMRNKEHLKKLKLRWLGDTNDSFQERKVLKGLQPHKNIEELSIFGYGGIKFTKWVGRSSYSNMVSLKFYECRNCISFPSLDLPSLEELSISKFDALVEVLMKIPLNSLKTLHIQDMKLWEKWTFGEEAVLMKSGWLPKLEEVRIERCPELKCISTCGPSHTIFESVNSFIIEGCSPFLDASKLLATFNFKQSIEVKKEVVKCCDSKSSKVILERLPSGMYGVFIERVRVEGLEEMGSAWNALEDFRIEENELIECISLEVFPVLKSLQVLRCENFKYLSAFGKPVPHPLTSLTCLKISDCNSLTCFPRGGISAPNLTNLELLYCSSLKCLPEGMHQLLPSLEKLSVWNCKEVVSLPEGDLPTKLLSLDIKDCNDKLIGRVVEWGLQRVDGVCELSLWGNEADDLDFFSKDTLASSSLTASIQIWCYKILQGITDKRIQLTSLSQLEIKWCPNLQCLPQHRLPSSLPLCPLAEKPCECISHITTIWINEKKISGLDDLTAG